MPVNTIAEFSHVVSCVAFDPTTGSLVAALENGDVVAVPTPGDSPGDGESDVIVRTGGVPSGIAFDGTGRLFIADLAHKAILTFAEGESVSQLVDEYENEQFKGPNSLVMDDNGTIFFTDSGPLGTTTLANPAGSVFSITGNDRILVPILHNCLVHPAGIALSPSQTIIYVAETGRNRLLRIVQSRHSATVFHSSVFYQFHGGFGPMGLSVDQMGNVYVSHFDFAHLKPDSPSLSIISPKGELLGSLPSLGEDAAEVTTVVVSPHMTATKGAELYIGESSTIHHCTTVGAHQ